MKRTLFVSHAYADDAALQQLLAGALPDGAEPVVFPAIEVEQNRRVSDLLMHAIRACDGLVHLDTEWSRASLWVQFECNYARRLGKPVFSFDPRRRSFRPDTKAAVDPIIAVNWNTAVARDGDHVRDVAHHLYDLHKFEIRGDKHGRLDNDLRQMLDSVDGLRRKMAVGGVGLLFLSNEGVCGGCHDWADPATHRRAARDFEPIPPGYTDERFGALGSARCLQIWLDEPDAKRIAELLDGGMRARWPNFSRVLEAGLSRPDRLVLSGGRTLDWNRVDDIMVHTFALAFSDGGDFRRRLIEGQ